MMGILQTDEACSRVTTPVSIGGNMAAGPIADRVIESRPLFEGAFRLNIADKESFALSDHLPKLAVFDVR